MPSSSRRYNVVISNGDRFKSGTPHFLGINIPDSANLVYFPERASSEGMLAGRQGEPEMTLCIAAECWIKDTPCIAMCCDTRAERGGTFQELMGSEDVWKMREIGAHTALLSGSETAADELLTLCEKPIRNFSLGHSTDGSDELITAFLAELRDAAATRKRVLIEHHLRMNYGLTFEEFLTRHRGQLVESQGRDIWTQINHLDLDADVLICGFSEGDEESVIVRLDRFGKTHWETNYSVIGAGADIALAFLCQREWMGEGDNEPQLMECLYRIYEAKRAAQANRHVGVPTAFEILLPYGKRRDITQATFDKFKEIYESRLKLPSIEFSEDMLEGADDEEVSSTGGQEAAPQEPGVPSVQQPGGTSAGSAEGGDSTPGSGIPEPSGSQS